MGVFAFSHLIVATLVAWAVYSFIFRPPNSGFATQMLATVLGATVFAWIIAPLNTIANEDMSRQLLFRVGGIVCCTVPVLIIYFSLRYFYRRQTEWR